MSESDGPTVYIQRVLGNLADMMIALEMFLRELIRLEAREAGDHLRREGFVDFVTVPFLRSNTGLNLARASIVCSLRGPLSLVRTALVLGG